MAFKGDRWGDKLILFYIRKVPDHPFKLRIVIWIETLIFNSRIRVKNHNSAKLQISVNENIGGEIVYGGGYEVLSVSLGERILNGGGVFLDIGANVGLYSIQLSRIAGVEAYAIEPFADNFLKLLNNIKLNNANNIQAINVGLGSRPTFGYLYNAVKGNSGTVKVENNNSGTDSYLITLTTLAELVTYLNIKSIKLLKIDVEGFEMNIFRGFFNSGITIRPENIIMEMGATTDGSTYTAEECLSYFKELGYECYNVLGERYQIGGSLPEANLWFK